MSYPRIVTAAVVTFAAVAAHAAGPVQLALEGALGDAVHLGPPAQSRATIVYFMSRRAKDESAAFAQAVDETLLNAPVESVAIVDLRRYGGILRRLASAHLRKSADQALARRRERRLACGLDASAEYVNRWHLVGDFDGSLFDRFGVAPEPAHPLAFVLDCQGGRHGPFRDVASLLAAVRDQGIGWPSHATPSK